MPLPILVTARYQYHLYREQNIVGPTWPGRRESRGLARSRAAGSLTPSADAEPKQKGKGTVVGDREYGYGLAMMIVWRIEGDGRQRKGVTGLLLSFLVWFGLVLSWKKLGGLERRKGRCHVGWRTSRIISQMEAGPFGGVSVLRWCWRW
jgi:hypothetical protein